ncbi:MAG: hypothetical protein PF485_04455 [Bacteroidales bacterium]|jgi:hypothetical protein|nr:hypothetical protein [Bacteroidales bacterium]
MISLKLNHLKFVFLFILIPFYANSQSKNDTITNINSKDIDDFSFLMINASYTNNNLEYLSDLTYVTEKIPTLFTNLSYVNKTGLYFGGSYANYFNANTQTFEYDIEAGFQKYFDNGLDIDLYYNKHEFSGDTLLDGLNYDHSLNFSTGVDAGKLYLSADLTYLLAKKNNFLLDLNISRSIQINKLFFKNDVLLLNPTIYLAFGTDYWIYEDMTLQEKYITSINLRSNGFSYNSFSYEGFNLLIPVSYGIKNTYVSFSWLYRIPGEKYKFLGWENQSSFMISLTYFLNFSNK